MDDVTPEAISLRPAEPEDIPFLLSLVEATMRVYVEQTWGAFSEALTRKGVEVEVASGNCSVVQVEGRDVGALTVERRPSHIQISQIYLLPSQQIRRIGTYLLRELIREAEAASKPLRLRVLTVNPARRLYEREGFLVTLETPERVYMEWVGRAPRGSAEASRPQLP